jgi:glycerol-3-phosphate responsive antiterminator
MQIEKYIYYLNKWGKKGEESLTHKYRDKLPNNFSIKITNPNGIIVMGRDNNISKAQKDDFEVIKRKYKNIMDIITYDDLISRLRFTIDQYQKT